MDSTPPRIIDLIIGLKQACTRQEERLRTGFCLSDAEYRSLGVIGKREKLQSGELARRLGLSFSRCSRIIEKLLDHELMALDRDPADRRVSLVRLTPAGEAVRNRIETEKDRCEQAIMASCTKRQLASIRRGVHLAAKAIANLPLSPSPSTQVKHLL